MDSEDTAWVFDSLIGFLHGPIWNAPLQTFIEEKSLIFEPTDDGQIFDRKEYVSVFNEYKNLVDLMLGSYMEDIGITPEQFEAACQMSKHNVEGLPKHFHQRLFEQIWAANDYPIFTKMMTQRNVELQLQALELIEQQSGVMPSSYIPIDEKSGKNNQDDLIMEQIKRLSMEDTSDDIQEFDSAANTNISIENINQEKISLRTALENFQSETLLKESKINTTADEIEDFKTADDEKPETSVQSIKIKPLKEDVIQRQKYLKQQRDKLLVLKRQIREKQLVESSDNYVTSSPRPKSAKVAKYMLAGGPLDTPTAKDTSLQLRKALAERLRSEVVDKP